MEDTLTQSGEYDWTGRLRRRCGLMSNYFDLLLYSLLLVYTQPLPGRVFVTHMCAHFCLQRSGQTQNTDPRIFRQNLYSFVTFQLRRRFTQETGDDITNVNFFTTTPSTTFMQCTPETTEFGEITQNKGHYAIRLCLVLSTNLALYKFLFVFFICIQFHSRSTILVPIGSSYTTSY